jgi:hypothetical protein
MSMKNAPLKKELKDYLDHLQTDDIVAATQEARRKSMRVLQDQGITPEEPLAQQQSQRLPTSR